MIPTLQEKLFLLVRQKFPDWNVRRLSGYVHGVVDGLRRDEPRRVYVRGFTHKKPYALGYIYGFIDAYGGDAFFSEWIGELEGLTERSLDYRWYEEQLYTDPEGES